MIVANWRAAKVSHTAADEPYTHRFNCAMLN
jgi:hypothetical protein